MRIGIDLRGVIYDSARRGIGAYAANLVQGLQRYAPKHWEFVLFVREGFPLPAGLEPLPTGWSTIAVPGWSWQDPHPHWAIMRIPKVRGLPFIRKPYMRAMRSWNQTAWEEAVRTSGIGLLHLVSAVDLGSYPNGNFSIPFVSTFLDAIPLRKPAEYFNRWEWSMQRHYMAQIGQLPSSACVVAISDFSGKDAIRYAHVPEDRVKTVYPPVKEQWFQTPPPEWAEQARERFRVTDPHFVFCSALDGHKNWERMLAAFVSVADRAHLVVVARDQGPAAEAFRKLRDQLGLVPDRCILTGWVEDEELIGLVDSAVALVSPSLQEGFGLPAAQAQALGVPVIASTGGSLPEVVADAGLLFDPHSIPAQAAAMDQALREDLRAKWGSKSKELRERFREEAVTAKLVQIYRDILKEPQT